MLAEPGACARLNASSLVLILSSQTDPALSSIDPSAASSPDALTLSTSAFVRFLASQKTSPAFALRAASSFFRLLWGRGGRSGVPGPSVMTFRSRSTTTVSSHMSSTAKGKLSRLIPQR